jgi:LysR family hca operon transcriptional activator
MELRHLRYFVAVAEEGSFTVAAERRLHTAQPSLSRQIRGLELELGVQLLVRDSRKVTLTPAGEVFLDRARLALSQVETACAAVRRIARSSESTFALGFMTGYEMDWMPEVCAVLRDELGKTELIIYSRSSPELSQALLRGELDAAFLRPDWEQPELAFEVVAQEPIVVILPRNHPLAARESIEAQDMAGEQIISVASSAGPTLRAITDDYVLRSGLKLNPGHEAHNLLMLISLVLSTPGISLLPRYAGKLLPPSVVSRPLLEAPRIDLAIGYNKSKDSPLLTLLLSRAENLATAYRERP